MVGQVQQEPYASRAVLDRACQVVGELPILECAQWRKIADADRGHSFRGFCAAHCAPFGSPRWCSTGHVVLRMYIVQLQVRCI